MKFSGISCSNILGGIPAQDLKKMIFKKVQLKHATLFSYRYHPDKNRDFILK